MNSNDNQTIPKISLLSSLYDISKDKFRHIITNEEINNFNIYKKCSKEIIELSLHHLLSSYEYSKRQGYISSLVIFHDYIKKAIKADAIDSNTLSCLRILFDKRFYFIPVYNNIIRQWSLIIIDSFNLLFKNNSNGCYNSNTNKDKEKGEESLFHHQFRIMYFASTSQKAILYTLINDLEKIFIPNKIYEKEKTPLSERNDVRQMIDNTNMITLPSEMSEMESALFVLKIIFDGIKSNRIHLYLDSIMSSQFNILYMEDMKSNIFIEIQRIVQLKFITKQESKFHKPNKSVIPKSINSDSNSTIKEIKIIFSKRENEQKGFNINKNAIVDRYLSNTNRDNQQNILLTECDDESNLTHRKKLLTDLDNNINDYYESDVYVCQTEPLMHLKNDSWPLTPERKIKEIKMPLIQTNLDLSTKKIYKKKVISKNNLNDLNDLSIFIKDASLLSQLDDSSVKMTEKFELDLGEQKQKLTLVSSLESDEIDVFQRNTQIPSRKAVKNNSDLKAKSMKNNRLITIRDYSNKEFINEAIKNESKDNDCNVNGCDWNNNICVII